MKGDGETAVDAYGSRGRGGALAAGAWGALAASGGEDDAVIDGETGDELGTWLGDGESTGETGDEPGT